MQKHIYERLITPKEAMKITWKGLSSKQIMHAKAIMDERLGFDPASRQYPPVTSELIMLCANLFAAGRVQGIREERQAKRHRPGIDGIAAGRREA